uniref:Uncharacterized protein n=1 Tax=Trichobilharzia regenti TaxID=157069 RepID=A0AA85IWV1_TRIRE|nr:unnamed protein product [Trichobilharzia regenti]
MSHKNIVATPKNIVFSLQLMGKVYISLWLHVLAGFSTDTSASYGQYCLSCQMKRYIVQHHFMTVIVRIRMNNGYPVNQITWKTT